jgi:hypothetical protein
MDVMEPFERIFEFFLSLSLCDAVPADENR